MYPHDENTLEPDLSAFGEPIPQSIPSGSLYRSVDVDEPPVREERLIEGRGSVPVSVHSSWGQVMRDVLLIAILLAILGVLLWIAVLVRQDLAVNKDTNNWMGKVYQNATGSG